MKLFLRFLLSMCLLLLGWSGSVQARETVVSREQLIVSGHLVKVQPVTRPQGGYHEVMRQGYPVDDDDDDALDDAEDEQDDRDDESPFGKHLQSRSYFSNCFFSSLTAYCIPEGSSQYSFHKHFSFSAADTYIVFRVIRI